VIEKKILKSLNRFNSTNKIDNYNNGGGGGRGGGEKSGKKRKKKSRSNYRTSQNIRKINVFLESLLSAFFP